MHMRIKSNLDEILYDRIIESLISGDYVMGENLTLDELARRFEVSRTPVVQAVKLLVNDGILISMSNGRLYVPEYSLDTVREMCEVRRLMEGYALDEFMAGCGRPASEIIPALENYAGQCRRLAGETRYVEVATADRNFHRTLVEASGNSVLLETYSRVQGRFLVANYLIRPPRTRNLSGTVAGHDAILNAIRSGEAAMASASLHEHIVGVLSALSM